MKSLPPSGYLATTILCPVATIVVVFVIQAIQSIESTPIFWTVVPILLVGLSSSEEAGYPFRPVPDFKQVSDFTY